MFLSTAMWFQQESFCTLASMFLSTVFDSGRRVVEHYLLCSSLLFMIPAGELLHISFYVPLCCAVCDSSRRVVEHYLQFYVPLCCLWFQQESCCTLASMFLSAVCDSSRRVVEHYLVCSSLLFCDTSNNVVLVGMRSLISKNYWLFSRLVF